jgi:hypothetical protein
MQQRKTRHLGWRRGEAIADQHQRKTAARRKRRERRVVRDHQIGPDAGKDTVPCKENPADGFAIGESRRREHVIQVAEGKTEPPLPADRLAKAAPRRSRRKRRDAMRSPQGFLSTATSRTPCG